MIQNFLQITIDLDENQKKLIAISFLIILEVLFFIIIIRSQRMRALFIETFKDMPKAIIFILEKIMSTLFIVDSKPNQSNREYDKNLLQKAERQVILSLIERGATKAIITKEVEKYHQDKIKEAIYSELKLNNQHNKAKHQDYEQRSFHSLSSTISQEQYTASAIKSRLTNLFIFFTLIIIGIDLVYGDKISDITKIMVAVTYITLSSFLIFIIRTSHQRTAMLIAIQEDMKKQKSLTDFFVSYKKGKDLTEHDIEFLRMMMVSRAERETKTEHPYELILKNISGSNIQLGKSTIKIGEESKNKESPKS